MVSDASFEAIGVLHGGGSVLEVLSMVPEMEGGSQGWGLGGRVIWIGRALTYLLLVRASKLFVEENGPVHEVYCLKRGDVSLWWGGVAAEMGGGKRDGSGRNQF